MMAIASQTAADGVAEVAFQYSVEELAALGALGGAATFPGTGEHRLEQPSERRAARRSLVARGTISVSPDGDAVIDPAQRAILACALRPGAVLGTRHLTGDSVTTQVVYVTRELCVLHAEIGGGIHRLAAFPTAALPRRVASLVALEARERGAGEPIPLPATAFEDLRAGDLRAVSAETLGGEVRFASSVAVVRQDGERMTAGDLFWLDAGAAGLLLADVGEGSTRLVPVAASEIVERLRLLLE